MPSIRYRSARILSVLEAILNDLPVHAFVVLFAGSVSFRLLGLLSKATSNCARTESFTWFLQGLRVVSSMVSRVLGCMLRCLQLMEQFFMQTVKKTKSKIHTWKGKHGDQFNVPNNVPPFSVYPPRLLFGTLTSLPGAYILRYGAFWLLLAS